MKSETKRLSDIEFASAFPIAGTVPGWRFRVREVSAGVYECEGSDEFGRRISRKSTDPARIVSECEKDARQLLSATNRGT